MELVKRQMNNKIPKGYKQTETGVIPEDWVLHQVNDLIDLLTDYDANGSFTSVAENVNVYSSDNYAWYVRSTDLENNSKLSEVKYVDKESYGFLKKTSLYGGELLFLKRGDIGNVYLFEMKTKYATVAPNLYLLKLNNKSNSTYLFYFFISNKGQLQLKKKSASSTLGALYKDDVKSIYVPLPPTLKEQKAIATALSDVDELITSLDQLITKKKAIKQGAMQELLTPPSKGGKRLPGFDGEWVERKLGEIARINMGQSPLSANYNKIGAGLPLVQGNADISKRKTIIRNYTTQITKVASKGDIIMSVRAPVGEIAVAKFKCCIGRGVCSLNYPNDFLYHYLIFLEPTWEKLSTGSTFDSINSNQLKNLEIKIPSAQDEQIAIAKILSDMDKDIEQLEVKKAKYKQIKQGMMQELLTGKTRLV